MTFSFDVYSPESDAVATSIMAGIESLSQFTTIACRCADKLEE